MTAAMPKRMLFNAIAELCLALNKKIAVSGVNIWIIAG
jgi:hypothetical protein